MSYSTTFCLTIIKSSDLAESIDNILYYKINAFVFSNFDINLDQDYETSWYDYQTDMIKLSENFPSVLFKLTGFGEESGDIWRAFYCNGMFREQAAELKFPDMDVDKFFDDYHEPFKSISDEEYEQALSVIARYKKENS